MRLASSVRLASLVSTLAATVGAGSLVAAPTNLYTGGTYTQSFDALPYTAGSSLNATNPATLGGVIYTLPSAANTPFSLTDTSLGSGGQAIAPGMDGWWSVGLSSSGNKLGAQDGDQTTGGLISFGAITASGTNRAIGLMGTSTTGITEVGMDLINNSGGTLNQITVSYTGELWRQTSTAKTLNFGYYVDPTNAANLVTAASGAIQDSNLKISFATASSASNSSSGPLSTKLLTDTISLASAWTPGTALWLTWQISSAAGSGQGLALDNLSFSAVNSAVPSTDTWNTTSGSWDTSSPNWSGGSPNPSLYKDGDTVIFGGLSSSGTVTVASAGVSPAAITISNSANRYMFQGGPIGGGGSLGLSKLNNGVAILGSANTYTGGTSVSGGTLTAAAGDSSLGSTSGSISISNGATLQVAGVGLISGRAISIGPGGATIDTGALSSSTSGAVSVNGPFTVSGGGNLTITGNLTGSSITAPLTIASGTSFTIGGTAGNDLTFLRSGGTFNGNLVVSAPVRLDFNNAVYAGPGEVQITYPGSINGNGSDGTSAWTVLANSSTSSTITSAGTLTSNLHLNPAGLPHVRSDVTSPSFTLATASTFIAGIGDNKPATSTFAVTGNIYGDADVVLGSNDTAGDGNGRLLLSGSNGYTGTTLIAGKGIIALGSTAALPQSTDVLFNFPFSGSTNPILDLNGFSQQINSLSSSPGGLGAAFAITNSGTSPASLTISGSTTPAYPYAGQINDGLASIALAKQGTGTLGLSGANNYTGGTTIAGGILQVSNTGATGTGPVTVLGGGNLASTPAGGAISGPVLVQAGGSLSPGGLSTIGGLVLEGNLTLDANSVLNFDLLDNNADLLSIDGLLTVHSPVILNLDALGAPSGTYTLATWGSTSGFAASDFSVSGLPANYQLQVNSTNNQLLLVPVAIPEPGTFILFAAAALMFLSRAKSIFAAR
jgi:fibronectin-binding autotransporter adhesin